MEWIKLSQVAAINLIDKLGEEEGAVGAVRFAKLGVYGISDDCTMSDGADFYESNDYESNPLTGSANSTKGQH